MKTGAWTTCPECQFIPNTREEQARHLMVTDHFLNAEALKSISERVKRGEALEFSEEQLKAVAASIPDRMIQSPETLARYTRIRRIGCFLTVALIVALICLFKWLRTP
jgi:hypothetical protein